MQEQPGSLVDYRVTSDGGLSIIVPTYNESGNIIPLLKDILWSVASLPIAVEIIVVDDNSPDGTAGIIETWLIATFSNIRKNGCEFVCRLPRSGGRKRRCIRIRSRPKKMGLASAVLLGFQLAQGRVVGFMDADSSHPPEAVPVMLSEILKPGGADLVIGSRYVAGAPKLELSWPRMVASRLANFLGRFVTRARDSTSGFLFFAKHVVDCDKLEPRGFKIGLEIIAKGNYHRFVEVPYRFSPRTTDRSKLDLAAIWHFGVQLARLSFSAVIQRVRPRLSRPMILR